MIMPENIKEREFYHKKMHRFWLEMVHSHLINIQSNLSDCICFTSVEVLYRLETKIKQHVKALADII